MLSLDIRQNYNGKLLWDIFSEIILYSPVYKTEENVEIMHRGTNLGVAKIEVARSFRFSMLRDDDAFLNMGKSVQKQAHALNLLYGGGKRLPEDTMLLKLVLAYTWRNFKTQEELMTEWWESKKVSF